ncbi:serine/threonine-protein kinase SBK1 isoform X1 [Ixodes scapularis]|nr:serine/threonine-protein kinase SBK1 isoform X1 [Ixodes scapularis]
MIGFAGKRIGILMSVTDGVRRPSRQFPMDKSRQQATIHRVRELQLAAVQVEDHYDVLREIGSGDYGKVVLARHRETGSQVALKAVPRATTTLRDFLIEFHYSYFLSPHMSILDTYDVCFETPEHYYFAQEVAPYGDLWHAVEYYGGIDERDLKIILRQIIPALEFMHSKELVHRDVRAENILIFSKDFTKVKLTDFGLTRKAGTLVKKRTRSLPTCPPEIWEAVHLEGYSVELGSDVWQIGMLIFSSLTAKFPWEKADITDSRFNEFLDWQKRKTTRTPREFKRFTPRLLRMMRRLMEPKPSKRYPVTEVNKYYGDRWLMVRSPRTSKVSEVWDTVAQEQRLGEELMSYSNSMEQRIHKWILSGSDEDVKDSQ